MKSKGDTAAEKAAIEKVVHASIGWAIDKDKDLLYRSLAQDAELFFFNPDDSYILGFEAFQKLTEEVFMNPLFKATGFEVRDMRINISRSGDVAWYSAILDDFGEWDGRSTSWINTRWTGVLEKREGAWVIVQMHFSFATPPGGGDADEKDAGK